MITITAHGRLAQQPELKLIGNNGAVCEFRLLSSRFAKGQEITEAVTFFCYDDMAEEFCSTTVKGQEIEATGVQESQPYKKDGVPQRPFVKYRLTWFSRGRKPRSEFNNSEQGARPDGAQFDRQGQRQNSSPPRQDDSLRNERPRQSPQQGMSPQSGGGHEAGPGMDHDFDEPEFY